jgi:hypothetical protein
MRYSGAQFNFTDTEIGDIGIACPAAALAATAFRFNSSLSSLTGISQKTS